MPWWGLLGSYRYPWLIAWLVPAWSVVWSCALGGFAVPVMSRFRRGVGETFARMMGQTRISSRYRMHCRSELVFLSGLEIPHGLCFAPFRSRIWQGGLAALLMRLVCWTGWVACQMINWGDRKSFGDPHSIFLVRAMWPDWQCSQVSGGSCAFCHSCHDL